jgi:hypothetical protein
MIVSRNVRLTDNSPQPGPRLTQVICSWRKYLIKVYKKVIVR